jgi:hypothetical protein
MSGFEEGALPAGFAALLRADALALAPPDGAKERVRLRLAATLGLAAGLGAAGGVVASATATASAGSAPAEGLLGLGKVLLLKKAVVAAVVAVSTLTAGTAVYVVRAQQERAAARAKVTASPRAASPTEAKALSVPAAEAQPAPTGAALGEERTLLDAARSAIAQGRLKEAQTLLSGHAAAFPQGQLLEERQALRIRLLVKQGQRAEAARLEARFKKEYPGSIHQPGIDEALRKPRP